uniref:GAGA-binding transcriptional activator n=1 Tax=Triphysaria pusilla TaxID=188295 RepID=H1ZN72_TRIPD|nr:GAGA-binding transcriptional activator [Triphysaria pusilla]
MDENGNMNLRNWGFLGTPTTAPIKSPAHLGLQLMSSMAEKPLFSAGVRDNPPPVMASTNGGPFHHHRVGGVSEPHIPIDYWMNQNPGKYLNIISGNYYQLGYGTSPETSSSHLLQLPHSVDIPKKQNRYSQNRRGERKWRLCGEKRGSSQTPNLASKEKKPRTRPPQNDKPTPPSAPRTRAPKKRAEIEINGANMDISDIPTPVCSCTGTPQQCYRWGSGGWQSACCTTGMSVYPLPMSTKRRGARIAGRKMSIGAFKKVLEKLTAEGYDFSSPIDLRSYWAKHGTNKFVTIR